MPSNEPVSIRIMCPNLGCQRVLGVPASARGKLVRCRECGSMVRVPAPKTQPVAPPPVPTADPQAADGAPSGAKPA